MFLQIENLIDLARTEYEILAVFKPKLPNWCFGVNVDYHVGLMTTFRQNVINIVAANIEIIETLHLDLIAA